MRDVNYGWMIRYMHANGAAFFFIFIYIHMAKGLYYGYELSSNKKYYCLINVIIPSLFIITGFLGYLYNIVYEQIDLYLSNDIHFFYNFFFSYY